MQCNSMQCKAILRLKLEKKFHCTTMWKQNPWSKPVKAFVVYWWYTGGILVVYWWCTGGILVVYWPYTMLYWPYTMVYWPYTMVCWWYTGGIFYSSTAFFPSSSLDLSGYNFKINLVKLRFWHFKTSCTFPHLELRWSVKFRNLIYENLIESKRFCHIILQCISLWSLLDFNSVWSLNFVSPGVGTYFERMRFHKIIDLQISMNSQSWQHDLDNTASKKCSIVNSTISSDYYYMQLSPSLQSQTISKDWNLKTSKEKYDVKISKNPWICKTNPIGSSWLWKKTHSKVSPTLAQKQKMWRFQQLHGW